MPGQLTLTVAEYHALMQGKPLPPPAPTLDTTDDGPEVALLDVLRPLVAQYAWTPLYTWQTVRGRTEVQALLVRGTELLHVVLLPPHAKPTMPQQTWQRLLAHTGKVETQCWTLRDRAAIQERLSRPER